MAGSTDFPGAVDDFAASSPARLGDLDASGRDHDQRHDDTEAAIIAMQTRILSLSIEDLPAGSVVNVLEVGGAYTRPTSRSDICVIFTGSANPASVALAGDKWDEV